MKAKKAPTKSETLEIQPFDVRVPWVRVQVFELKMVVDYLLSQSPKIVSSLGKSVATYAVSYEASQRQQDGLENAYLQSCTDLKGRTVKEITIVVEAERWKWVQDAAKVDDVNPSAIVRYGLRHRWRQLKEFNRSAEKKGMETRAAKRKTRP